jgi:predicted O-methyltransferase YrrM
VKDRLDAILRREQAEYLESLLPPRDPLLSEMERFARQNGHPIADPEVAQLMRILVRLKRPQRIVEVGTNIGYSVVVMGRECDSSAVIETIELKPDILEVARRFVKRAALPCRVEFHQGPALEVLGHLPGPFDFAFIDCVKTEYSDYVDLLMPGLEDGALVVFDNLLWKGEVAESGSSMEARALRKLNATLVGTPGLLSTVLPVSDGVGIMIVEKKKGAPERAFESIH